MQGDGVQNQSAQNFPSNPSIKGRLDLSAEEVERLSQVEREIWLAKKQLDEQRRLRLRHEAGRKPVNHTPDILAIPVEIKQDVLLDCKLEDTKRASELAKFGDDQTRRFKPPEFQTVRDISVKTRATNNSRSLLDFVGWTLEGLVIIAVLVVVGNWALQQFGISIDFSGSDHRNASPSRSDGLFLNVMAEGNIYVPPTSTPLPVPPTPTLRPLLSVETLSASQIAIVPTPTPYIVQAAQAQPGKSRFAPPTRLVVPKIGVDSAVQEVIVNLGNWQVADYAVGFHQGTANAGDSSNMVLAGHRDIRGSIFLRLNELIPGDEIKVYSNAGSYRYIVSEIIEVLPTDVRVMLPTSEGMATLITCTPVGFATKRLVVKAKLVG
ncbi:sortase [Candidatus Chlorohelix sp.]|uniref:sortase n=1 Tax=Candidatus Chlorohelix sp. TaxID=3139201 RepID=UPI0030387072